MQTVDEVRVYLELELAEAYAQYDAIKGKDARAALFNMTKIGVILDILEAIK